MTTIGVDLGLRHERDADEFIAAFCDGAETFASTHVVTGAEQRHIALAFDDADGELLPRLLAELGRSGQHRPWALVAGDEVHGEEEFRDGAREAAAQQSARESGRVVRFPGVGGLTGKVTVAQVLASAVDRVAVLAAADAPAGTVVVTRDFVRPRWSGGELVLHTQPNRGDTLVPFESPNPTPCCQDH